MHTHTCSHRHVGEPRGRRFEPCTSAHTHALMHTGTHMCTQLHTCANTRTHILSPTQGDKEADESRHTSLHTHTGAPTLAHDLLRCMNPHWGTYTCTHVCSHARAVFLEAGHGCPALLDWAPRPAAPGSLPATRRRPCPSFEARLFRSSASRVAFRAGLWGQAVLHSRRQLFSIITANTRLTRGFLSASPPLLSTRGAPSCARSAASPWALD